MGPRVIPQCPIETWRWQEGFAQMPQAAATRELLWEKQCDSVQQTIAMQRDIASKHVCKSSNANAVASVRRAADAVTSVHHAARSGQQLLWEEALLPHTNTKRRKHTGYPFGPQQPDNKGRTLWTKQKAKGEPFEPSKQAGDCMFPQDMQSVQRGAQRE